MDDFKEVIKGITQAVMNDYHESPYKNINSYWNDMRGYWSKVFSTEFYQVLCSRMDQITY